MGPRCSQMYLSMIVGVEMFYAGVTIIIIIIII